MNRRKFLKHLALTGAAAALSACTPQTQPTTPTPTQPPSTATPAPGPTTLPTSIHTATPLPTSTPTSTPDPRPRVGIARAASYDPALVRRQLAGLLDGPDGLAALVRSGSRVAIKSNLTGAPWWDSSLGKPATELYVTHPAVVAALGELCRDAGAAQIFIIDGLADASSWRAWGYEAAAKPLNAQLVDLCSPKPYSSYRSFPVGAKALVYKEFTLNPLLADIDVLISVAKMKAHSTTGVTLTLKNLVGLTPIERYKRKDADTNRSALHNTVDGFDDRMPRVIIDLNLACPVQLGVVDGIITCEGAAGPWDSTLHQVKPGLLVAGRSPLAVDAVTTAVMGFDPQAPVHTRPFLGGENIMELAYAAGLGTNRLSEIRVTGETIDAVRFPFKLVGEKAG